MEIKVDDYRNNDKSIHSWYMSYIELYILL